MITDNRITPNDRDVLNGRGQGVQRHPGNVKYRKLVFVNKGLYAKCPRSDKIKISKGIVAAIRESGGRFLEHNERNDFYFDIGDKKATEKTSQALREGQKDIRKNIYKTDEAGLTGSTGSGETSPASNVTMPEEPQLFGKELPKEDYWQYSLLVLEALYNSDRNMPVPPTMTSQAVTHQPPPLPPPAPIQHSMIGGVPIHHNVMSSMYGAHYSNYFGAPNAAMAMALDQFPGARMPMQPMSMQPMPMQSMPVPVQQNPDRRAQFSMGAELSNPSFRLTDMSGMSFGSISLRQIIDSCYNPTGARSSISNRGTFDSRLSAGTLEMFRLSSNQLKQIDQMDIEDLTPSPGELEVFDRSTVVDEDRVSDLRFSDLSRDRFTDFQEKGRSTDSTNNSSYSDNSLMTGRSGRDISSSDSDMAQLLLGLANDCRSSDNVGPQKMEEM